MPERIQLRRTRGWRKPEGAIVVTRPSKWGNPFVVGGTAAVWHLPGGSDHPRDLYLDHFPVTDAAHAVRLFRSAMTCDPALWRPANWTRPDVAALAGHDLACWCPLEDAQGNRVPCHADVLLEIANGGA